MYKAQTKLFGSIIWIGTKADCLKIAKQCGIPRKEFTINKV